MLSYVLFSFGITLHAAFKYKEARLFLNKRNIPSRQQLKEEYGVVRLTNTPDVIVAMYSDDRIHTMHMFLHSNYTLTRCIWHEPLHTSQKILIFLNLLEWTKTLSLKLHSNFTDEDDQNAWNYLNLLSS